jgi:hypothetical protein
VLVGLAAREQKLKDTGPDDGEYEGDSDELEVGFDGSKGEEEDGEGWNSQDEEVVRKRLKSRGQCRLINKMTTDRLTENYRSRIRRFLP